jgi:hypothetical protein
MTTDLLTPQQVADILRIKKGTLEVWRAKRIGPAWIKLGDGKRSLVRYRKEVIDEYLRTQDK